MAFDQNKYIEEYKKQNYDRIRIQVYEDSRKKIKEYAIKNNVSVSQLIIRALEKTYLLDLTGDLD